MVQLLIIQPDANIMIKEKLDLRKMRNLTLRALRARNVKFRRPLSHSRKGIERFLYYYYYYYYWMAKATSAGMPDLIFPEESFSRSRMA
jgi:hypothetical protein